MNEDTGTVPPSEAQQQSLRKQIRILARDYGVATTTWPTGAWDQLCQQFNPEVIHWAISDIDAAGIIIVPTIKETRRCQPRFPPGFCIEILGEPEQEQDVLEDLELLQQRQYVGSPAKVCISISDLSTNVLEALFQTIDQYNERRLNSSRGGKRWRLLRLCWTDLFWSHFDELEALLRILERPSVGELFNKVSLRWRKLFCNMGALWPAIIRGRIEDFHLLFTEDSQVSLGDEQTLQVLNEMISDNGGQFSQSCFRRFRRLADHSLSFRNPYELRKNNVNLLLLLVKNCFPYLHFIGKLQDIKDTARLNKEDDFLAQLEELEVSLERNKVGRALLHRSVAPTVPLGLWPLVLAKAVVADRTSERQGPLLDGIYYLVRQLLDGGPIMNNLERNQAVA